MANEDFIISFRADIKEALGALRQLVDAATRTEKAINKAISGTGQAAGVGGLKRVTAAAGKEFDNMIARADGFDKRLRAVFSPAGANAFMRSLQQLTPLLGRIEEFQVAKTPVPDVQLRSAIKTLTNLRLVLQDDEKSVKSLTARIEALNRVRLDQARAELDRLKKSAADAAARGDIRLQVNNLASAEKLLLRLQSTGANVRKELRGVRDDLDRLNAPRTSGRLDIFRGAEPQLRAIRTQIAGARLLGDTSKEESGLRRYNQRLAELATQGVKVSSVMSQVRQRLDEIAQAKLPTRQQAFLEQTAKLRIPQIRSDINLARGNQDINGQIRGLIRLEQALNRMRDAGFNTTRGINAARQGINALKDTAENTRQIQRLEGVIQRVNRRILEYQALGNNPPSTLVNRGLSAALEQQARGYTQAGVAADRYRSILANLPAEYNREITALLRQRDALYQSIRAREAANQRPTATQLGRGLDINTQLVNAGFAPAAVGVERFDKAIKANALSLDHWANSFRNHGLRIAEGLVLYNALGTAMGGVRNAVSLVAQTDVELARFQAVVGDLPDEEVRAFTQSLADISVDTNTPMRDLLGTTDVVATGLRGLDGEVTTNVESFQRLAGELANVIGLNGQQEEVTRDLVAIFKVLRAIDPSANLDTLNLLLDQFVVAGGNSQEVIRNIVQGIREIGPNAKAAGTDLNFLGFIIGDLVQTTGQSGTEIGGLLRTTLAKLSDPDVIQKAFFEVGDGIVKVTERAEDGSVKLLNAQQILINMFRAVEQGAISRDTAQRILEVLNPPLNPAAIGLNTFLFEALGESVKRLGEDAPGAAGALGNLNDIVVKTLGGRFEQIIRKLERLIVNDLLGPIGFVADQLINILDILIGIFENDFTGVIARAVTSIAGITLALGLMNFAFGKARLFVGALITSLGGGSAALKGLGTATATLAATTTTLVGPTGQVLSTIDSGSQTATRSVGKLKTAWNILEGAIRAAAKAALFFIGLDLASQAPDKLGDITATISGEREQIVSRSRINPDDLARGLDAAESFDILGSKQVNTWASFLGSTLGPRQRQNVINLAEAFTQLRREGKLTAEAQKLMESLILGTNGAIKDQVVDVGDLIAAGSLTDAEIKSQSDAFAEATGNAGDFADTLDEVTAAELRAQAAIQMNNQLTSARAAAISELNTQLQNSTISLEEYTSGVSNVNSASEAAANWASVFGDNLSLIPGLQEEVARTGGDVAEALFNILSASDPEVLDEQIRILDQMVEVHNSVADQIEQNPVTPTVDTAELAGKAREAGAIMGGVLEFADKSDIFLRSRPLTPTMNLTPFRLAAARYFAILQSLFKANSFMGHILRTASDAVQTAINVQAGGGSIGGTPEASDTLDDILKELQALGQGFDTTGGIRTGDSRLDSDAAREPSQTSIIDLGDLPPSAISQIVALAAEAQRRVVAAGGTVDDDETVAFFKDAAFQQLISGIDQKFLQQAIEELTEVEKRRLELEQERLQDVTRELSTRVGPIQSLVSAPVLAAGGGVLTGQGLNADPRLGNITINVPINWSGMSLSQLQQFIYQSIQQAWVDAGRGA